MYNYKKYWEHIVSLTSICLLLAISAGCSQPAPTIVEPSNDTDLLAPPQISIAFPEQAADSVFIFLNEVDVSDKFQFITSSSSGDLIAESISDTLTDFWLEGVNMIEAGYVGSNIAKSQFYLYTTGPDVYINSAAQPVSGQRLLSGRLWSVADISGLTINGGHASLVDSSFSEIVTDSPLLQFSASDELGRTKDTFLLKHEETLENMMLFRLNEPGLTDMSDLFEDLLGETDWSEVFTAPIFENESSGLLTGTTLEVTDVNYAEAVVQIEETRDSDALLATVEFNGLDLSIYGNTWIGDPDTNPYAQWLEGVGNIDISRLEITVTIDVTASELTFSAVVLGAPETEFETIDVSFGQFTLDQNLLAISQQVITQVFEQNVLDLLPSVLANVMDRLVLDTTLTVDIGLGTPTVDLNMNLAPANVDVDAGGLNIWLQGKTITSQIDTEVQSFGSFFNPEGQLIFPDQTGMGANTDSVIYLSQNMIDQLLSEVYRSGSLNFILTRENIALLNIGAINALAQSLSIPLLDPSHEVRVSINIDSVPGIDFYNRKSAHMGQFNLNEVYAVVEFRENTQAPWQQALNAKLHMDAAFKLRIDPTDQTLDFFDVFPKPRFVSEITTNTNFSQELSRELVTALLPSIVDPIVAGLRTIQLPSLLGFTLDVTDVWQNSEAGYIGLATNLISD